MIECIECSGSGLVFINANDNKPSSWIECEKCGGKGKIDPFGGKLKSVNESGPKE